MDKRSNNNTLAAYGFNPEMMSHYIMSGLLIVAAFLIGVLFTEVRYLKKGTTNTATNTQPVAAANNNAPGAITLTYDQIDPVTDEDHLRGNKNADVTLIEYSDLECPFCKTFHTTLNQVMEEYDGKVNWVFRHYPLTFHANAQKAGEAAECAAKLGGHDAFWKFTDLYFSRTIANGTGIAIADMPALANEAAGVNADAVKKCMDSDEMAQKVKDQIASGSKAGVSGTPGTILVTSDKQVEFISGAQPYESLKATLDKYVK